MTDLQDKTVADGLNTFLDELPSFHVAGLQPYFIQGVKAAYMSLGYDCTYDLSTGSYTWRALSGAEYNTAMTYLLKNPELDVHRITATGRIELIHEFIKDLKHDAAKEDIKKVSLFLLGTQIGYLTLGVKYSGKNEFKVENVNEEQYNKFIDTLKEGKTLQMVISKVEGL